MRIEIDRTACAGHGLCYVRASRLFDADEQGYPVILVDEVVDEDVASARSAVGSCPERALTLA